MNELEFIKQLETKGITLTPQHRFCQPIPSRY